MTILGLTDDPRDEILNLEAGGGIERLALPIKASEGAIARGQVLEYDDTAHAWKKYTSGHTGKYAIAYEAGTITDSVNLLCIIKGQVNVLALDATAQADPDIDAALLGSGLIPRRAMEM